MFEREKPKFGISSLVSFSKILSLYFLQISATFLTVIVSFVTLNVSDLIGSSLYKAPRKLKKNKKAFFKKYEN